MTRKFLTGAAVIAVGAGVTLAPTGSAQAAAAEFFKCKLAEDVTMEQLVEATAAFLEDAHKNGHEGYSVRFLSPVFSGDISPGTFWWVGVGPTMGAVGALNDYWEGEANTEHRDQFRELTGGCEMSSMHVITNVDVGGGEDDEEDD